MEKGTRSFRDYEDAYEPFFLLGAEGRGLICWGRRVGGLFVVLYGKTKGSAVSRIGWRRCPTSLHPKFTFLISSIGDLEIYLHCFM